MRQNGLTSLPTMCFVLPCIDDVRYLQALDCPIAAAQNISGYWKANCSDASPPIDQPVSARPSRVALVR